MKKQYYYLLAVGLVCFTGEALAVSCEVDYNAKRVSRDRHWYGSVERPEFKSGTVKGSGDDLKACVQNAITHVERDGWVVTSHQLK